MQLLPEGHEHPWSALAASGPDELWLLVAPFRILEMERIVIPMLALRGPVHLLVGGRGYDVDVSLRRLRKLTPDITLRQRIRQRSAPTAFQMRALLKKTPATRDPLIVLISRCITSMRTNSFGRAVTCSRGA